MYVVFVFLIVIASLIFTLLLLIGPVWLVFHYVDRWKRTNAAALTSEEAGELKEVAEKLEARVQSLEKVLDDQAAGWRDR